MLIIISLLKTLLNSLLICKQDEQFPSRKIKIQFTFDIGKSASKLFLSVMQIKGKLLLSVNTGYKLRNFARTVTE